MTNIIVSFCNSKVMSYRKITTEFLLSILANQIQISQLFTIKMTISLKWHSNVNFEC